MPRASKARLPPIQAAAAIKKVAGAGDDYYRILGNSDDDDRNDFCMSRLIEAGVSKDSGDDEIKKDLRMFPRAMFAFELDIVVFT